MKRKKVYILIGEREEVGQTEIGGPFVSSFSKEIVIVYSDKSDAEKFINSNKLKKPIKERFAGTRYPNL